MKVNIQKVERPKIIREALIRRTTKVYSTDASRIEAMHLRQVHKLPERVQQDIGESKILCFR